MELEQQKRVTRKDLVHPKFIRKWASRYIIIADAHGKDIAREWANSFLNPEDGPLLAEEVRKIRQGLVPLA